MKKRCIALIREYIFFSLLDDSRPRCHSTEGVQLFNHYLGGNGVMLDYLLYAYGTMLRAHDDGVNTLVFFDHFFRGSASGTADNKYNDRDASHNYQQLLHRSRMGGLLNTFRPKSTSHTNIMKAK